MTNFHENVAATRAWRQAADGYLVSVAARFAQMGIHLMIRHDLETWASHIRGAPGRLSVAPTYDPDINPLAAENSYWVAALNRDNMIVGSICNRCFDGAEVSELLRSNRLWWDPPPTPVRPVDLVVPETLRIAGRIGVGGGLWVHPDVRGVSLGNVLGVMNRVVALSHYAVDWQICFMQDQTHARGRNSRSFMEEIPTVLAVDGRYPALSGDRKIWLGYLDQTALRDITFRAAAIERPSHADSDQESIDVTAFG